MQLMDVYTHLLRTQQILQFYIRFEPLAEACSVHVALSIYNIQLNSINKHKHYLLCQLISTIQTAYIASDDQF